jgi:DNA polymerase III epsilon subunit-like protein
MTEMIKLYFEILLDSKIVVFHNHRSDFDFVKFCCVASKFRNKLISTLFL